MGAWDVCQHFAGKELYISMYSGGHIVEWFLKDSVR